MPMVRIPDNVVFRPFGEEMVVLNLGTGQYHGLNRSGGRMLEILAEVGDTAVAAPMIAAEFGHPLEDVARDLAELCTALEERSLVTIEAGTGEGAGGGSRPNAGTEPAP